MSHITIRWDGSEGKVRISPSFRRLYDMARLDCLKDAIYELQQEYEAERIKTFHTPKLES